MVTAVWAPDAGDPAVPNSGSVKFSDTAVSLAPGARGLVGQVSQTPTFTVKPGDQYTLGIHGFGAVQGFVPPGVALFFFLELNVTYLGGSSDNAAAGGSFVSFGQWQSGTNQLIVNNTKTPTGITATVGAYWQNLTDSPISFLGGGSDGWQVYVTAAGVVKTPQGFGVLPSPLGIQTIPTNLVLGNGFDLQAAQVTQGNDADTLAFYAQSTPAAGTPIKFQSWQTQAAVSRLQDQASIQFEQYIVGDDGERSAIVSNLSPLPRTSEDCDNAALAFLADRTRPYYNGSYLCTSLFFSGYYSPSRWIGDPAASGIFLDQQFWPTAGRFLHINSPYRGIQADKFLVTGLNVLLLDELTELLQYQIQFGADLHLEKVLKNFVDLQPLGVLTPQDKALPPDPRFTQNVDNSFLADLSATYTPLGSITPFKAYVVVNDTPDPTSVIEIRRLDGNWGDLNKRDYVSRVTTTKGGGFWLDRQTFDQQWFLRQVRNNLDGSLTISRRSKVIRLHWPLQPSPPLVVSQIVDATGIATASIQFNFNGDQRNIYGFELRAADNFTVLVQKPITSYADLNIDLAGGTPLPYVLTPGTYTTLIAYFFNAQWSYSTPTVAPVIVPNIASITSPGGNSATFGIGIGGAQAIGTDLTPHFMWRGVGGTFAVVQGNCKTYGADTTTNLIIDIQISHDQNVTWNSIFPIGQNLVIQAPSTAIFSAGVFSPSESKIGTGDMLRIDLMPGSNETCLSIEVVVSWGV